MRVQIDTAGLMIRLGDFCQERGDEEGAYGWWTKATDAIVSTIPESMRAPVRAYWDDLLGLQPAG